LIALNAAIRNGDAHLKNFGILYDEIEGDAHLAPVYDLVTTTVYLAQDRMALTMAGSTEWPTAKKLVQFGELRGLGSKRTFTKIFERIADGLSETAKDVAEYGREHPEFTAIGQRMVAEWETGIRESLTLG
jgi:serine/threonine-protein kinase HipA